MQFKEWNQHAIPWNTLVNEVFTQFEPFLLSLCILTIVPYDNVTKNVILCKHYFLIRLARKKTVAFGVLTFIKTLTPRTSSRMCITRHRDRTHHQKVHKEYIIKVALL